jgi:hypothetical protein
VKWRVNRDEALELIVTQDGKAVGVCVGGIWRGAWKDAMGQRKDGYHAARWFPYKRVGRFEDVKQAKAAVEKAVTKETTT